MRRIKTMSAVHLLHILCYFMSCNCNRIVCLFEILFQFVPYSYWYNMKMNIRRGDNEEKCKQNTLRRLIMDCSFRWNWCTFVYLVCIFCSNRINGWDPWMNYFLFWRGNDNRYTEQVFTFRKQLTWEQKCLERQKNVEFMIGISCAHLFLSFKLK